MKEQGQLHQHLLSTEQIKQYGQQNELNLTPTQQKIHHKYFSKSHFLNGTNFIHLIFFTWVSPLLSYGYRIPIDQKAIPYLKDNDRSKIDYKHWKQSFQSLIKSRYNKSQGITLIESIIIAFDKKFFFIYILAFIITLFQLFQPVLSYQIINYIQDNNKDIGSNFKYFFAIFGTTLLLSLSTTILWYQFTVLGFNLSNVLSLLIYNKALQHPLLTDKQFTISNIINFSQVDAQRLSYFGIQLTAIFFAPIKIMIALLLLAFYIGISFLVGLSIMILLMLFTYIFSKISARLNDKLLKQKDSRMKVAQQMLQIIKYIKTNTLQKYFYHKINAKRQIQLSLIKKINILNILSVLIFWASPPIIVAVTFLVYVVSLGHQIKAAQAFFTIIIFNIVQSTLKSLPNSISNVIQIWSSMKRVQKFLFAHGIDKTYIQVNQQIEKQFAIIIQNGNFLWGELIEKDENKKKIVYDNRESISTTKDKKSVIKNENFEQSLFQKSSQQIAESKIQILSESGMCEQLKDKSTLNKSFVIQNKRYKKVLFQINIKIPSSKVTMIIGNIGSGKSSLLYAILNQMTPEPSQSKPKVSINGSVAYSSQKPWIMSGSVKQNILFFHPYNEQRLKEAIHYSCLQDDLKILINGLDTQIGQKGINLSGGQKARISFARTLYSNQDIYLLDDILSAVDVHIGKFIMEQTILQYLKGKTVIMPTHAVKYLENSDNIIIMKKGKIVQSGSYKQVCNSSYFKQIMVQLSKNDQQQQITKPSKQDEQIIKELKQVNQAKISLQKLFQPSLSLSHNPQKITDKIVNQLVMPQDHKKGQINFELYSQYIRLNGGKVFALSIIFLMSCWVSLAVLSNIQIQHWCQSSSRKNYYLYLYLSLSIAAVLFSGIRAYILITSGIRQGRTLHKNVIKALLYTSLTQFYNRVPIGRILNRLSKDLRQIDQVIGNVVGTTLVTFFSMLASLILCIYASTPFVIIPMFLVSFVCIRFLKYYLKTQRQCVRLQSITTSPIVSSFTSTINGITTIRAYNLQDTFLTMQMQKIDTNKRMRITRQALQSWFALRLTLLSFLINMSALAYSILSNNSNQSLTGLLLTYSIMLSDDVINFSFSFASLVLKMISIQRVCTFTKIQAQPGYIEYCNNWNQREQGSNKNIIKQGIIQFKQYSTRYRQGLPLALISISITIGKGQKIGIVGRSGAGKTTLMNSLIRIIQPTEGEIYIDGKNISEYKLKDLRSSITIIEQQPTLMNDTFKQNLDPSHQYSNEQINKVLQNCGIAQIIQSKGGINAFITNDNLSVGQKQLLCICRAFLKSSQIILIDQATANVDVRHDKQIQQVIAKIFKSCTVLTIAHRLTTLQNCDKILVLSEGKVIQWDTKNQLLKKPNGVFKKMWEQCDQSFLK